MISISRFNLQFEMRTNVDSKRFFNIYTSSLMKLFSVVFRYNRKKMNRFNPKHTYPRFFMIDCWCSPGISFVISWLKGNYCCVIHILKIKTWLRNKWQVLILWGAPYYRTRFYVVLCHILVGQPRLEYLKWF